MNWWDIDALHFTTVYETYLFRKFLSAWQGDQILKHQNRLHALILCKKMNMAKSSMRLIFTWQLSFDVDDSCLHQRYIMTGPLMTVHKFDLGLSFQGQGNPTKFPYLKTQPKIFTFSFGSLLPEVSMQQPQNYQARHSNSFWPSSKLHQHCISTEINGILFSLDFICLWNNRLVYSHFSNPRQFT